MQQNHLTTKKGFTLIELLLYLSVSAIIITIVSIFLATLNEIKVKNQVISTVEDQGMYISDVINATVRVAKKTITPNSSGASSLSLELEMVASTKSPTKLYVTDGVLYIKEGASEPLAITDSRIAISELKFFNVTPSGATGHIWYSFKVKAQSQSNRYQYEYEKIFETGASVRYN
jgi:prepilin-type N-terminal cleavage/methylation domain-containing protein